MGALLCPETGQRSSGFLPGEEGAMRNLVVISEVHGVMEGDDDSKLQVAGAAVDVDDGLFFVVSQSSALICYSLSSSTVEWIVALDEEARPVVAMEWRVELEFVVVGRSSGQVVEVNDSGQEVQEVGSLKGGLQAMAASPDGPRATELARGRQVFCDACHWKRFLN